MKNNNLKIKSQAGIYGTYVIKTYRAGTKELLRQSAPIKNLIVNGATGYGKNLLARALMGASFTTVYPLAIDSASIGTGTNTPASSDTGLQTPVVSGIVTALGEFNSASEFMLSFYIPSGALANGTYKEFGLFCGRKLFARSLISPSYTKGTSEDTTIEYTISIV